MLSPRPSRWVKTIENNVKLVQFNMDVDPFERKGLTIASPKGFYGQADPAFAPYNGFYDGTGSENV